MELEMIITARERSLGEFSVRRILPYATHRMVGPFIFFDHMGPAKFPPGKGMSVRPHPHIGLATVTYLFEGQVWHRDSLGSNQMIEPGAINWMTAGRGIVHSERTPEDRINHENHLHGIQCWVALPEEHEDTEPSFKHHTSQSLPEFVLDGVRFKVLLGQILDKVSPVKVHSDLFYVDVHMTKGQKINFPSDKRDTAAFVVEGRANINSQVVEKASMAVGKTKDTLTVEALEDCRLLFLGGSPMSERYIYWNFVSSSAEKIEKAKADWKPGPGSPRFPKVPGDDQEFIPLPDDAFRMASKNPKGTVM